MSSTLRPSAVELRGRRLGALAALAALVVLAGACAAASWNDPYSDDEGRANTLYGSFSERPKHLDPARSYSTDEQLFIGQIYEPPLEYHYLVRPYALEPLTLARMPRVTWLDANGKPLADDANPQQVASTLYEFEIRPGIRYQPHPAFARDAKGGYAYHHLDARVIAALDRLADLPLTGTRELRAEDCVYAIKRLADPHVQSPIAGLMKQYIVGLAELSARIAELRRSGEAGSWLDLRRVALEGVSIEGPYRYSIRIKGVYPQFLYWQAMTFFAPMPWEADRFYSQPGLEARNISLDWYPVGTGPFYLTENNPNLRMVLARNPNFHGERYPVSGAPGDERAGLLVDAGAPLPFIDSAIYSLEKEAIPRWSKFLQGYYDRSSIVSDNFDQAIELSAGGEATLTDSMRARGISLSTTVATSIYYMGFNMLDPVLGGRGERARLLRRAISIAVDFEEYIAIFLNGRGVVAQDPIPPDIYGHLPGKAGIDPYVYEWVDGAPRRRSIEYARSLMEKAGYAGGVDRRSGKPLVLYFEAISRGPDDKARLTWMRRQFEKLDIQLVVRATDYNRFREKMLKGTGQIYMWGWRADYPDPENFLFLLYGPHGKAEFNGENASNYSNPEFDALFDRMKNMTDGEERLRLIREMVGIVQRDAPWAWGFYPKDYTLKHAWLHNAKPNLMASNTLKYLRVDPQLRAKQRARWNRPVVWPVLALLAVVVTLLVSGVVAYRRRERSTAL